MTVRAASPCPPPESIAAFVEGKLAGRELESILEHVEHCDICRTSVKLANQTLAEQPSSRRWWIALAAAAVIAVIAVPMWLSRSSSPIAKLAALAPRNARVIEPRLSGGFAWAPYRGLMRARDGVAGAEWLKLAGAAGSAIERAGEDSSASAQHAAGVAHVLVDQPREGIELLRNAALRSPDDPSLWSDLAAAQYAAALRLPEPSLLPQALASADRALRVDPRYPEALFNRALALERMGLIQPARAAWTHYLEVDSSSPWAVEARRRLVALPQGNGDAQFRKSVPGLERGTAAIDPIVTRWREQSRAWAEAEFLGRWGEASLRGDHAEAQRLLVLSQSLGAALRRQSGEALLADAVDAIRRADPATQRLLAEAHATYRRGRIAYSRKQPAAAEPDLRRAAALFARAQSPMSRMARHYAANTRFDQNDLAGARAELEALLAENGERSGYFACGALTRWQLSLCHTADGDAEGALQLLADAASALRRLDERNHLGFVESLLADTFSGIGRPDDSWSARIRSFEILSRDGREDRLLANVASAADIERRRGNRDSALALLALEREIAREIGRGIHDDVLFSNTLVRSAVLSAEFGDAAVADDLAREAAAVAARITDPGFRAIVAANVQLARGAATLRSDPRGAATSLRSATDAYREMGHTVPEIDSLLFRARAAVAFGDLEEAARAIDEGLDVYERFRPTLDSASELFAEGVRVSLERGQPARAFAYAERSRARLGSIPSRVLGAALLEIVVLPEELVLFCLDDGGLFVAREKIARDAVLDLARRCAGGERAAAIALYDHLIRPVPRLRNARTLIVVADRPLDTVPFAALVDRETQRYLIEQCAIVFAESGASLRAATGSAHLTSAVAVALPSDLSETAAEAREVAQTYARGASLQSGQSTFASFTALARDAEVLHISGHTEDAGNGGTSALVFAGPDRVPWRTIAASSFPHLRVAVLAACQTLRAGTRAPSLAGAFLAAGADDAIGTLQPIGDRDARELFRDVHRELAAGASPAAAVRRVQLRALARDRDPAWSNLAVLTRVIPNAKEPL